MKTFLQLFLLFDVFMMGILAAVACRHAYAHFRPPKPEPKPHPSPQDLRLPAAAREHLLGQAEANFKAALDHSATQLHHDLAATAERLNKLVEHLGTEIVSNELERYQAELAAARKQAEEDLSGIRDEITKHKDELKTQLEQEMAAEKQRLIEQIDTKLADAVGSFLIETLQHNVDLGAQGTYLTSILEEHKADFKKEVGDEAPAAK